MEKRRMREKANPVGLQVKETNWIYYGNDDNAILPLALKFYYGSRMYTGNGWDSNDKERVKQFSIRRRTQRMCTRTRPPGPSRLTKESVLGRCHSIQG
jgi:hypothetical protein